MAHIASFRLPEILNEPNQHYEPGSKARKAVLASVKELLSQAPIKVSCIANGKPVETGKLAKQYNPADHATAVCEYHEADEALIKTAIDGALEAQKSWSNMPWNDRAAIFLKAADLIAGKYRAKICAATMIGQGKNMWQAEIDAAAELVDFLRFGVKYAEELYAQQPPRNSATIWNRTEHRPLEGFVLAVSPFNFTAIAGNLVCAPAMLGNVCVWKPSPLAILSGSIIMDILHEAGLPPGVIQFVPGDAPMVCKTAFASRDFAALHFTGSTHVFRQLWKDISSRLDSLRSYPRIVGETGGKNFHLIHPSADLRTAALESIRAAFEYQGQKCSALSRLYVAELAWPEFKKIMVAEMESIKQGDVSEATNFMGPVIARPAFDKITGIITKAKEAGGEVLSGGTWDDSKGYFIKPTLLLTKDPHSISMTEEIFGPVATAYVYPDADFEKICDLIDTTTQYALTGAVFSRDRAALILASNKLRNSAGNFYINCRATGAVVGQQPFGGARASGTNDKAGSINLLYRFVNTRSIKETFVPVDEYGYPSNQPEGAI